MINKTSIAVTFFQVIAIFILSSCGSDKSEKSAVDLDAMQATLDASSEIHWLRFDEGFRKAKEQNRPMLVDFTASWCGWCRKMEAETFIMPSVIREVNKRFIPVKVWGDSDDLLSINDIVVSERQLTAQAGVSSYPYFAILNPSLERLHFFKGYHNSRRFLAELDKVQENY